MDELRKCIDVLRHLAKAEPNRQVLAAQRINEYLQEEVAVLRASLVRLNKAIDDEAEKGQGKDWSLIRAYVFVHRWAARCNRGMAQRLRS